MANIKDLKKRIRSTKGTLKITMAMKLVAASKLAKAQAAIINARPYVNELENTIKTISSIVEDYSNDFMEENGSDEILLLAVSTNKGLCGGLNQQLFQVLKKFSEEHKGRKVHLKFIGKKAFEYFQRLSSDNINEPYDFSKLEPQYEEIREIIEKLQFDYLDKKYGKIFVAYTNFHSALALEPKIKQILPLTLIEEEKVEMREKFPFDFKYDPDPKSILDNLIPESIIASFNSCILDSLASEHGARMTAMDSAVSNSQDIIRDLTIKMNKLRQAAITTELIEVISGAETLNA